MPYDNYGSQSGHNSLNVGVGDFRRANINIGGDGRSTFTPEQIAIERHQKWLHCKSQTPGVVGFAADVAGLIGFFFTLYQAS